MCVLTTKKEAQLGVRWSCKNFSFAYSPFY